MRVGCVNETMNRGGKPVDSVSWRPHIVFGAVGQSRANIFRIYYSDTPSAVPECVLIRFSWIFVNG